MLSRVLFCLLAASGPGAARVAVSSDTAASLMPSPSVTSVYEAEAEPCARVSASLQSYADANPSATSSPQLAYNDTRACALSAPIVEEDAVDLVNGLSALFEFQSDLEFLANPPPGYPLAPVDILRDLQELKSSVQNGSIQGEIEFETRLATIVAQAHDGHMNFRPDGLSVFRYSRPFGALTSISMDGKETPKIYFWGEMIAWLSGETNAPPSAITQVNGQDVAAFVDQQQQNGTYGSYQDPDALYNAFFWAWNTGASTTVWNGLFGGYALADPGPTTSIAFENGTTIEQDNYARLVGRGDFSTVVDGESLYNAFMNATAKDEYFSSSRASASMAATATAATTGSTSATAAAAMAATTDSADASSAAMSIQGFPQPLVISEDGAASGYFLDEPGFGDTAVLVLREMSTNHPWSFQATVREFLSRSRSANKTRLVLDISGNPGGGISLGLDVFKQLFPDLELYNAGNYRAHESFRLLGESVTPLIQQQLQANASNFNSTTSVSPFAATIFNNATGQGFTDFASYYGPVDATPSGHGSYTNLARYNFTSSAYSIAFGDIIISGYVNNTDIAVSPFAQSSDIIILSDGRCGSTCTLLTHLLKYQGKVKSIVTGGRPVSAGGPVQAIGGVKGATFYSLQNMRSVIDPLYQVVNSSVRDSWNGTAIDTLFRYGLYLGRRTASWGQTANDVSLNIRNNIAEHDTSLTPLQFVYEAADCRLWVQPRHLANVTNLWADAAATAFGNNGTDQWSLCTQGSTGHESSLSGNATLYNGGNAVNVTSGQAASESADSSSNGGGQKNAAVAVVGGMPMGAVASLAGAVAAVVSFCL